MNEKWTAYDWALNESSKAAYFDYEERLMNGIEKRMRKTAKR